MERFINILIIDDDPKSLSGLKSILTAPSNNVLLAVSLEEAYEKLRSKEIGIVLLSLGMNSEDGTDILDNIKKQSRYANCFRIVVSDSTQSAVKLVRGFNSGAVDYISKPFNPNLIRAKIEVYKTLYFKDLRIGQLLENIFPEQVLHELNTKGKYPPKRVESGIVLFTDFVDFSVKSKGMRPLSLLQKLEKHFKVFDEIMERYHLEKIKTIGDAYMALAGVTEKLPHPAIRACLAALEIRDYIHNEKLVAQALKRDFWDIRIGLHQGPLVAGIIGSTKFAFDVWGDTVNIASRAEQVSSAGEITITKSIAKQIGDYFKMRSLGIIDIQKRGGKMEMFYLLELHKENCLYGEGKIANRELREKCGLSTIDFRHMRVDILNRLKALLPDELVYHDMQHTLNVEKAAMRYAKLEGLTQEEVELLSTAALYHDAGFIIEYENNEELAISMARSNLPRFGYNEQQIQQICGMIAATRYEIAPTTLLEKILVDADHDYLGRPDYNNIADRLRVELEEHNQFFTDKEWIQFQLNYLQNIHVYYTETALNIRLQGKNMRIEELKRKLEELETKEKS